MDPIRTYLALGTNLGDRQGNIDTAICLLEEELGSPYIALSDIVETQAWGFVSTPFLNCVLSFDVCISPEELLDVCKDVERRMGRTDPPEYDSSGNRIYHARTIDVDILLYGGLTIDTERLTIPHPQIVTRPFIRPLLDQVIV